MTTGIDFCVLVSHPHGHPVPEGMMALFPRGEPFEGLTVRVVLGLTKWSSSRVDLFALSVRDYADAAEPSEAFAAAMRTAFEEAARWLSAVDGDAVDAIRQRGYTVELFCGAYSDTAKLYLNFPPRFLTECGRLGLELSILENP